MRLGGDDELAELLCAAYAKSGLAAATRALAGKKLERLRRRQAQGEYVPAIEFVRVYLRLEDHEKTFATLDLAAAERNVFALLLKSDPFYDRLRKSRRFRAILTRNGLI